MATAPRITVVGSANIDLVARCERLPRPGRDGDRRRLRARPRRQGRQPGGRRRAARARACASSGGSAATTSCCARCEREGVDTSGVVRDDGESGVALILVDASGENVIVVAPGANRRLAPDDVRRRRGRRGDLPAGDPRTRPSPRGRGGRRFFCLNAAPARGRSSWQPDLLVVNRYEYEAVGAVRRARGADARRGGRGAARGRAGGRPGDAARGRAVDGTAAGDAFCAALVVSLLEGGSAARRSGGPAPPGRWRPRGRARSRRCRPRPRSMRSSARDRDHPRLRPRPRRRDRAAARARQPRGGAARRDHRLRQPDAREDDRQRDPRARPPRPRRRSRWPPARRARSCASAAPPPTYMARPGSTAPSCRRRLARPSPTHAIDWIADDADG